MIMRTGATPKDVNRVVERLKAFGLGANVSAGVEKTVIGVIGERKGEAAEALEAMDEVERVVPILAPYKLASRNALPEGTIIQVGGAGGAGAAGGAGGVEIGGQRVVVMAGPCAVEGYEQLQEAARAVKAAGATMLRGGAFKPRTSPYSFQGMEEEGLKILAAVREETGLPIVTEVMDTRSLDLVVEYTDVLQIGTRNMQNFHLLREVGRTRVPVILKRGMAATIEEWLMSAEYIMSGGNHQVILCERGIRTFETVTRNTLDLSAVPVLKEMTHLPVIVDPSHGTGKWKLVAPMAKGAVAVGTDGLMIEVHPKPEEAVSDGPQSLTPQRFAGLMADLGPVAASVGRRI